MEDSGVRLRKKLPGWTNLGFVVIQNLPKELQNKLIKINDAVTVSQRISCVAELQFLRNVQKMG